MPRLHLVVPDGGHGFEGLRGADCFGFDGLPPTYAAEVEESGGKVLALRLIGMADEPMLLKRQ